MPYVSGSIKRCYLCLLPFSDKVVHTSHALAITIEHVIPVSRGGSRRSAGNRRAAHYSCNQLKGSRLLSELDEEFYIQVTGGIYSALQRVDARLASRRLLEEARQKLIGRVTKSDIQYSTRRLRKREMSLEFSRWEDDGGHSRGVSL